MDLGDQWRKYVYYILIGVISVIAMVFLPMVGSEVGMEMRLPTTSAGWVVFVSTKGMVATINILIFHAFILQAKVNVKNDENYILARTILSDCKDKKVRPRSPEEINRREYGAKGVTLFFTTILGSFSLGQAILMYDWMQLLTYVFTVVMGIIFGILEMKKYEEYYTVEYLAYAKMRQKEEEDNGNNDRRDDMEEPGGASRVEQDQDS
jgi:hypothetical protein